MRRFVLGTLVLVACEGSSGEDETGFTPVDVQVTQPLDPCNDDSDCVGSYGDNGLSRICYEGKCTRECYEPTDTEDWCLQMHFDSDGVDFECKQRPGPVPGVCWPVP